jgi:hypothetical protein
MPLSGLCEALAACRGGDTLVVTKLDRLARSLPDARQILEDLTRREVVGEGRLASENQHPSVASEKLSTGRAGSGSARDSKR